MTTPVELTSYTDGNGWGEDVWVEGKYIFYADSYDGVEILNGSNLLGISYVGRHDDGANAYEVHVEGDMFCVADYRDGFEFINWSDPTNPFEVTEYDYEGNPQGVFFHQGIAYGAAREGGVRILAYNNDEDNVSTWLELNVYGTDYYDDNSDSDTLSDYEEIYIHGTDPTLTDTDGDGLSDSDEVAGVTNPLDADSDDDGLNDGEEYANQCHPLEPDTDFDGLNDYEEIVGGDDGYVTSPTDFDTDDDGLLMEKNIQRVQIQML